MPGLDYGAIMAAGRSLVPDLRQQAMQQEQFNLQKQAAEVQLQGLRAQQAKLVQDQQEKQQYQAAVEKALTSKDPQAILDLMARFPSMAGNIKPVWEAMDKRQRTVNLTQMGTIYARGQTGDLDGARTVLRDRIAADTAAGHVDPTDQAILAGLESDDPVEQQAAIQTVGIHLAMAGGPDKFAEAYKSLTGAENKTTLEKQADYYRRIGRADLAESLEQNTADPVVTVTNQYGTSAYRSSQLVPPGAGPQPKGGDQSTPAAGYTLPVEGGTFTSGFGAPRDGGARSHNGIDIAAPEGSPVRPVKPGKVVAVGNQPDGGLFVRVKHEDGSISGYAHLARQDVKVGDAVGATSQLGTVGTTGNATGPVVHLVIRDRSGRAIDPRPLLGGGPVQVATLQQANALPKGTRYRTPDGREFVR